MRVKTETKRGLNQPQFQKSQRYTGNQKGALGTLVSLLGGQKGHGKGSGKRSDWLKRNVKSCQDRVVWIGGFAEKESKDKEFNKQLHEFINKKVEGCKFVTVGTKGQGSAVFGSDEEASNAIASLNGVRFKGKVLEFDVW